MLTLEDADGVIGKPVRSAAGEDMGRIIDVIVGPNGQVRAAVIDFGGFLGVGSRKVAVDWRALQFTVDGRSWRVTASLTRNQVRSSPEYKGGEPIVVLGGTPRVAAPAATQAPAPAPAPQAAAPAQASGQAAAPAPTQAPAPAPPQVPAQTSTQTPTQTPARAPAQTSPQPSAQAQGSAPAAPPGAPSAGQ